MARYQQFRRNVVTFAVIGFFALIIYAEVTDNPNNSNTGSKPWEQRNWQSLTLPDKKQYLEAIQGRDINQWHDVRRAVKDLVKEQAQFPEELEFGDDCYYVVECMDVKSYSDGHALFTGEVVGKNAYGVEKRVTYFVKLQVRPNGIEVLDAEFQ